MVPNITISEQFAPLIDLDMQFVNQLQVKLSFSKSQTAEPESDRLPDE